MPWGDAALTIQVRQGFHVERRLGIADVHGDREALRAAAKDADAASTQQPLETFGGGPVDGTAGRRSLGDLVQETDRVGVRLGNCCRPPANTLN